MFTDDLSVTGRGTAGRSSPAVPGLTARDPRREAFQQAQFPGGSLAVELTKSSVLARHADNDSLIADARRRTWQHPRGQHFSTRFRASATLSLLRWSPPVPTT